MWEYIKQLVTMKQLLMDEEKGTAKLEQTKAMLDFFLDEETFGFVGQ